DGDPVALAIRGEGGVAVVAGVGRGVGVQRRGGTRGHGQLRAFIAAFNAGPRVAMRDDLRNADRGRKVIGACDPRIHRVGRTVAGAVNAAPQVAEFVGAQIGGAAQAAAAV